MKGQSILLTGASGFIGRHLLRHLARLSAKVIVACRTTSSLLPERAVKFLPYDLGDADSFKLHHDILQRVSAVVHLGGFMLHSSDPSDDDPVLAMKLNAEGTAHLLQYLPATLTCFCLVSTIDVYGPPQTLPIAEDHPTCPATYYGASKLAAEKLLDVWSQRTGVPVTVLRLSQVYGPGDTSNKVIPSFIRSILGGGMPVLIGDGSDVRDYVFVEDVIRAMISALTRCHSGILNVATGRSHTIGEVTSTILRLSGNRHNLISRPSTRPATHIVINIERAKARLGYEPEITLEEGLYRTLSWHRNHAWQ